MTRLLMGILVAFITLIGVHAENWPLEPGKGVGPVRLGAPMLSPTRYLTPDRKLPGSQGGLYLTYKEGVETECQNNQIIQIVIKATSFKGGGRSVEIQIPGGLRIGSASNQLQSALGMGMINHDLPTAKGFPQKTYYAWPARGVGAITEGGKVVQFTLWPAK